MLDKPTTGTKPAQGFLRFLGFGDNRGWGGSNASDFSFAAQLGGATLTVDGKPVIEKGQLK